MKDNFVCKMPHKSINEGCPSKSWTVRGVVITRSSSSSSSSGGGGGGGGSSEE